MEKTEMTDQPFQAPTPPPTPAAGEPKLLLQVSPSLTVLAGSFAVGILIIVLGGFLIFYSFQMNAQAAGGSGIAALTAKYKAPVGGAIILIACLWLLIKSLILKSTVYTISTDRIERRRGILTKTTDNLDFWRVNDVELRQTILDRLLGIGSIDVISTDQTDPRFVLHKVNNPREVYEVVKRAGTGAAKRAGVLRIESMTS